MTRIDDVQQVKNAVSAYKGKSVGNLYWMTGDLQRHIEAGKLYQAPAEGGVGLVLHDDNRRQFCFKTNAENVDVFRCCLDDGGTYVSELIFPAGDGEKPMPERKILSNLGFSLHSRVAMMTLAVPRAEGVDANGREYRVVRADAGAAEAVDRLYMQSFDLATDNPPVGRALQAAIADGQVWLLQHEDGDVCGAAVCEESGRSAWIRHLAVRANARGKGLGKRLMLGLLAGLPEGAEKRLWVKMDNAPAIKLYSNLGFLQDRRLMEIWVK